MVKNLTSWEGGRWGGCLGLVLALVGCTAPVVVADPQPTPAATPWPSATPRPSLTPTASPSPTATPVPEIRLVFTGDISPGRCVYTLSKAQADLALPYRPLAQILQAADVTIGSLDAALSDHDPPPPCMETMHLLAPAETGSGLQWAGFDVLTLATNHAKDCGLAGDCGDATLLDTLTTVNAAGLHPVGAGRNLSEALQPVVLKVNGVRFAFLAFSSINPTLWATAATPGNAPFTPDVYLPAIQAARAQADVVIVLPHWGTEYSPEINWEQYQTARQMAEAGATLIVGNHPHRVQGVETFPTGAVAAYALGNFVFDQQWSDGSQFTVQGVVLTAVFRGAQLQTIELTPIHIYDNFQPRLAPPAEATEILQAMSASLASMPKR